MIQRFVTWDNENHEKLSINKTNELVVDYNASNADVSAKKLHMLKHGYTHIFRLVSPI